MRRFLRSVRRSRSTLLESLGRRSAAPSTSRSYGCRRRATWSPARSALPTGGTGLPRRLYQPSAYARRVYQADHAATGPMARAGMLSGLAPTLMKVDRVDEPSLIDLAQRELPLPRLGTRVTAAHLCVLCASVTRCFGAKVGYRDPAGVELEVLFLDSIEDQCKSLYVHGWPDAFYGAGAENAERVSITIEHTLDRACVGEGLPWSDRRLWRSTVGDVAAGFNNRQRLRVLTAELSPLLTPALPLVVMVARWSLPTPGRSAVLAVGPTVLSEPSRMAAVAER